MTHGDEKRRRVPIVFKGRIIGHSTESVEAGTSTTPAWGHFAPMIRDNVDPPPDVLASLIAWNGVPDEFRGYVALRILELANPTPRAAKRPAKSDWEKWQDLLKFKTFDDKLRELQRTYKASGKRKPFESAFKETCRSLNRNWTESSYRSEQRKWRALGVELPE